MPLIRRLAKRKTDSHLTGKYSHFIGFPLDAHFSRGRARESGYCSTENTASRIILKIWQTALTSPMMTFSRTDSSWWCGWLIVFLLWIVEFVQGRNADRRA